MSNGLIFPRVSFGLQEWNEDLAEKVTLEAIGAGYRNFFASARAKNQRGFARGIAASGLPREELFICGSVYSGRARGFQQAYLATLQGCEENLQSLAAGGLAYVDLIMLDAPAKGAEAMRGQWRAFEDMLASGGARSLAVSNFSPQQLDSILSLPSAPRPVVNQLRYSVGQYDSDVVEENRRRGVAVQAYSPLNGGRLPRPARAACAELGRKYGKSFAQVALRWILQRGACFTTQSFSKEHLVENRGVFDFALTDAEMEQLSAFKF